MSRASLMFKFSEQAMKEALISIQSKYDQAPNLYESFFTKKETPFLYWSAINATVNRNVAADVVARGASIAKKTREVGSAVQGEIPKIAISRELDENEFYKLKQLASANPNSNQLIDAWYNDVEFCYTGCKARLEWLAWQAVSTGKVQLTNANNNQVVSKYDIDFGVPSAQKGSYNWFGTYKSSAKPLTVDIPAIIKSMKSKGINVRYMFMNADTLAEFAQIAEVKEQVALGKGALVQSGNTYAEPSLEEINARMKAIPSLRGMQIVVINSNITVEDNNGGYTELNPFADNAVVFTETTMLGELAWVSPVDTQLEGSSASKAMQDIVLIKKFSEENPILEVTQGICNAFPAYSVAKRSYIATAVVGQ